MGRPLRLVPYVPRRVPHSAKPTIRTWGNGPVPSSRSDPGRPNAASPHALGRYLMPAAFSPTRVA